MGITMQFSVNANDKMFAALMMGHHFPISAFCNAPRASALVVERGEFVTAGNSPLGS